MKKIYTKTFTLIVISLAIILSLQDFVTIKNKLVRDKLNALEVHSEQINTLFLGSSKVYRSFDTVIFDSVLVENGIRSSSFNFGMPSLLVLEAEYYLEKIFITGLPNLNLLILEVSNFTMDMPDHNLRSWRTKYYHDFKRTAGSLEIIWRSSYDFSSKASLAIDRLKIFSSRLTRAGEAYDIYRAIIRHSQPKNSLFVQKFQNFHGFLPLMDNPNLIQKKRKRFLSPEGQDDYRRKLADAQQRDKLDEMFFKVHEPSLIAIKRILKMCEKRGIKVILLDPPGEGLWNLTIQSLKENGATIPIIDMNQPENYPELFDPKYRFEQHHLNKAGSKIATRVFAELVLESLRSRPFLPKTILEKEAQ